MVEDVTQTLAQVDSCCIVSFGIIMHTVVNSVMLPERSYDLRIHIQKGRKTVVTFEIAGTNWKHIKVHVVLCHDAHGGTCGLFK